MKDSPSQAGYSLIEVLVALTMIGLASAGGATAVSNALAAAGERRIESAALRQLHVLVARGRAGEGQVALDPEREPAHWTVRVETVHTGAIGGVDARWVNVLGEISWRQRGRERALRLSRMWIVPSTDSP